MSTDAMPATGPGPGHHGQELTRAQLLKRERERRLALLAERARGGTAPGTSPAPSTRGGIEDGAVPHEAANDTHPVVPDGFETHAEWREAHTAAVRILQAAGSTGQENAGLADGRALPAAALARAVVEAVRALPPLQAAGLLADAYRAGLSVVPDVQALRVRVLLRDDGGGETPCRVSGEAECETSADRAWRLYIAYERMKAASVDVGTQRELLEYLPLPVVDDLIDACAFTVRAIPEGGERRPYLRARLTPSDVGDDEVRHLGWHSELARREFYRELERGDPAALERTDGLTATEQELVAELTAVRASGRVPLGLSQRRWLWPVLERLAPQTPVNLRRDKSFGPWLLVRRIQRAVRMAHQARLRGEEQKHLTLLRAAWNDAQALRQSWSHAGWEARNAMAYLLVLHDDTEVRYEEALEMLRPARGSGMREDRLPGDARERLESNREVLHQLARQRDRGHLLNPYLVMGVPDGAAHWKEQWRKLRRILQIEGEALLNAAKDSIEALERGHNDVPCFAVPLMPGKWGRPSNQSVGAVRGSAPMPRQTAPAAHSDLQFARQRAAAAIVEIACETVGLPRAPTCQRDLSKRAVSSEQ